MIACIEDVPLIEEDYYKKLHIGKLDWPHPHMTKSACGDMWLQKKNLRFLTRADTNLCLKCFPIADKD